MSVLNLASKTLIINTNCLFSLSANLLVLFFVLTIILCLNDLKSFNRSLRSLIVRYLPDSGEQFAAANGAPALWINVCDFVLLHPGLVYSELGGAASAYRVVLMYIAPGGGGRTERALRQQEEECVWSTQITKTAMLWGHLICLFKQNIYLGQKSALIGWKRKKFLAFQSCLLCNYVVFQTADFKSCLCVSFNTDVTIKIRACGVVHSIFNTREASDMTNN